MMYVLLCISSLLHSLLHKPPSSSDSETAPAGILKHNWVKKHSQELPALVVFFFDLEWDEPQWEEKVTECASKVKVIRSEFTKRNKHCMQ